MEESFYSLPLLDSRVKFLVFSRTMYNDEDWKDDLREKKRLSDEEIHKNKRSWKRLSSVDNCSYLGLQRLISLVIRPIRNQVINK